MNNNSTKSSHILNASANLVGFSFLILTSLKVMNLAQNTFADNIAALAVVIFIFSIIFSFVSIRTKNNEMSEIFETIADNIFLGGVFSLLLVCVLLVALK